MFAENGALRNCPNPRFAEAPRLNPESTDRNGALDGIRGLAILWVFAFHANALLVGWPTEASPGWGQSLAEKGLLGVQLFFVLSGFLLARPWMQ
ncbi:MAG: hypothetical protein EOM22_09345, partial [Gammaproteobacteria bacterium]|nr:hypothetical protein [Gammaproteobacteria bacterium]